MIAWGLGDMASTHVCLREFDPECADCIHHDETCGTRCDRCSERMCEFYGPVPRACGVTCADCPCSCGPCAEAARDREDERRHEMARDERWGS